ncbi:MAG: FkbM family methyltransferase [Crocinitomicaceae bacterium]|nr:FkbM family methyltransferase [Crocinitomicaceae bacterium]
MDFIKCDTEGAELFVLRGADDLVRHCKPLYCWKYLPTCRNILIAR